MAASHNHREPAVTAVILLLFALLFVFVVFPLARVLGASVMRDGAPTLDVYREMLTRRGAGVPLWNSLRLAVTVAVTGTVVGLAMAYMITMVAVPGRKAARVIATLPMLAPPFMIALAAIMLFGRNGIVTRTLIEPLFGRGSFEIYGFGGLVLVQTLTFFPLSMLLLIGTLSSLDPSLEEAAQSQGAPPGRVFRDIVLPLATPGLLSSMLLLFIESLADFGNPLILGGDFRVLSVSAFLRITGEFDTAGGAVLAMLLLVPALSAFFVQRHFASRATFATISGKPTLRRANISPRMRLAAAVVLGKVCFIVCAFYAVVAYGSVVRVWGVSGALTLSNYTNALHQAGRALSDSLLLAAVAAPVAGAIGMAAAWLLVRRSFRGRSLLGTLAMLTFALPGTVVGIGYILAFNTPPLQLTGTALIIIILFVFRGVPVALEAGRTAIEQVDPSI
ncbi:MAG: iron ABC transporter permease, partial [Longimicrobiales bacterium]